MNERPTHRLLIDESPLQFQRGLAVALGVNEAIFLQQLHYWLMRSQNERDGRWWVYNTLDAWVREFPFWSAPTIRRIIAKLEELAVVLSSAEYNTSWADRTKWYTIDYARLEALARSGRSAESVG